MSANRKAVSTFLDIETAAKFEALCASRGLSRYKALEQAVKEWMERYGEIKPLPTPPIPPENNRTRPAMPL